MTSSFGAGKEDFWVLKLDKDGNVQWEKTDGGTDDDEASSVHKLWTEEHRRGMTRPLVRPRGYMDLEADRMVTYSGKSPMAVQGMN